LRKSPEPLSCRPKDGQSRQAEDGRAAADSLLSEKKGTVLAQREGIFEIQRPADGPGHSSQANPAKNVISEISKGKAEAASRESIFDIKPMGESAQAPVLPSRRKAALGAPEDGHLDNDASGEYPPLELDLSQLPLAPTQAGPGEEVYEGEPDKCMLMAAEILKNMVRFMGFGTEVKVNRIGERIILELLSEENALLIGRKGASLDALQLLVNKLCRKAYRKSAQKDEITDEAEEDSQRIIVDAENYRARRQQILLEKTLALANRVLRTRKPQTLPQLTAQERHLVHLALSQVEGLSTRSHGTGALRNLFIFPSNRQKG
jgi:spoIIIJ-associated protein